MSFVLEINVDNEAFTDEAGLDELARILTKVAEQMTEGDFVSGHLYDINGNVVGAAGWRRWFALSKRAS